MQVMVLEQDQNLQAHIAGALMEKGFQVICVESIGAAENFIRLDFIDVLVMGERVGGRLSHSLALLAECRNPLVSAILLTDRTGPSLEEIFDLIPSIYGILGRKISPNIVAQVVLASTLGQTTETAQSRLSNRWAEADTTPSIISIGPEFNDPAEHVQEDCADDTAAPGFSEADVIGIEDYEAGLTERKPMELAYADVEITAGDFADAGRNGADRDAVVENVLTNADGVQSADAAPLPLVSNAPQMLAGTPAQTERVAEPRADDVEAAAIAQAVIAAPVVTSAVIAPPAAADPVAATHVNAGPVGAAPAAAALVAVGPGLSEHGLSKPVEARAQAMESRAAESQTGNFDASIQAVLSYPPEVVSGIGISISSFATGWPQDDAQNTFGSMMADLPDFDAGTFGSVMPAAISRATSPSEAADRRLHLA